MDLSHGTLTDVAFDAVMATARRKHFVALNNTVAWPFATNLCDSLRDFETCLQRQVRKLAHIGLPNEVSRNTLAKINPLKKIFT